MLKQETFSGRLKVGGAGRVFVVAVGVGVFVSTVLAGNVVRAGGEELTTAAGKPVEGGLDAFRGDPVFERQLLFSGGDMVRGPNITVAVDGTVLAKGAGQLRRSTDGGKTWDEPRKLPPGALIVDDTTGDILSVSISSDDRLWRSKDVGSTWTEEEMTLKPNEVMRWLEWTGLMTRGTSAGSDQDNPKYYLHLGASETGITLWHCEKRGRLLNAATFRPHAKAHPSDREGIEKIFSCAVFSDDDGATWQVTGLFPEGITEEASLAELQDGRIYHNSRSGSGYYDKSLARELRPDEVLRREAWSYDCGETWEDLRVSRVLPDGGGYGRGYGMMGGLARLPVKDRDILIYSNADTAGGDRIKMTVWASFDGAQTWPVKRLVYEGPSAYSSMAAGRPETPSEGNIYVLFEGAETHRYHGIQVAQFNLSWLLEGDSTGDGDVPQWVSR